MVVYAHREETPEHQWARAWLTFLAESAVPWGLPVFCIGEFIRVVTHPRIFDPPSTLREAVAALSSLTESPSFDLLMPGPGYLDRFASMVVAADARGNMAFDAQIAALCQESGYVSLLTLDRDFARFPGIKLLSRRDVPEP